MGVRAVVAAGRAIDDRAGQAFAATFYLGMLAGETFGEAVRFAREHVWLRFPDVKTRGAYQCYGDRYFRFHSDGVAPQRKLAALATLRELVVEFENLAADLRAGAQGDAEEKTEAWLARIPVNQKSRWLAAASRRRSAWPGARRATSRKPSPAWWPR